MARVVVVQCCRLLTGSVVVVGGDEIYSGVGYLGYRKYIKVARDSLSYNIDVNP